MIELTEFQMKMKTLLPDLELRGNEPMEKHTSLLLTAERANPLIRTFGKPTLITWNL